MASPKYRQQQFHYPILCPSQGLSGNIASSWGTCLALSLCRGGYTLETVLADCLTPGHACSGLNSTVNPPGSFANTQALVRLELRR